MSQIDLFINKNPDSLQIPGFLTPLDQANFRTALTKLKEIKKLLDKGAIIGQNVPLPSSLSNELESVLKEYNDRFNGLSKDVSSQSTQEVADYFRQQFEQINNYHNAIFQISSSNNRLYILNTINTYGNELAQGLDEKVTVLVNRLGDKDKRVDEILKELETKAKENVISNYAEIFAEQERRNSNLSRNWLITSIFLSALFLFLLICSIENEWLKITTTLTDTSNNLQSTREVFDLPLLISKFLIISFTIYIITFCFKQYSINKHLQIVNQQRKNAINSYKLFEASFEKNDSTKNLLMLELAKAIYELTHSGYITKGSEASNSQVLEWTKLIDAQKP